MPFRFLIRVAAPKRSVSGVLRAHVVWIAALATALLLVLGATVIGGSTPKIHAAAGKPNILFVLTDDLDTGEMSSLPEVNALVAKHGVTFDENYVSDSLCCPSRTSLLRVQFAHNTGVRSNGGANGGFDTAHRLGVEADTIATRLQARGYRTGLFGKYLNGYPGTPGRAYIPPGWTEWASPVDGHPYTEYDYTLNHDEAFPAFGSTPRDYGTDVYLRMATRFVQRSLHAGQPFFAYVSVFAPHEPATPAPADVDRFAGAEARFVDRGGLQVVEQLSRAVDAQLVHERGFACRVGELLRRGFEHVVGHVSALSDVSLGQTGRPADL